MRFLVRENDHQAHTSTGEGPDNHLDLSRAEGSQLLSAADEAIRRALARSDSESFLQAGRQQGGE
jgi:hypothetical protein